MLGLQPRGGVFFAPRLRGCGARKLFLIKGKRMPQRISQRAVAPPLLATFFWPAAVAARSVTEGPFPQLWQRMLPIGFRTQKKKKNAEAVIFRDD